MSPRKAVTALTLIAAASLLTACTNTPSGADQRPATHRTAVPYLPSATDTTTPATSTTPRPATPLGEGPAPTSPTASSPQSPSRTSASPATSAPAATAAAGSSATAASAPASLLAAPREPRITPDPTDFRSPEAVAAAYFLVWCWQPVDQDANTNIAAVAPWMTAAGWNDDRRRAITDAEWALTVREGTSLACGPPRVAASPGSGIGRSRWVIITAQQAQVRAGEIVAQYPVNQRRRFVQTDDGRWFVDVLSGAN